MTNITKVAQALDTQTLRALVTRLALEIDPEAKLEAFPEALAFQIDMARAVIRAALQDKAGEVRCYEPAGFLLHWPATGGGRQTIWSETRAPGLAIGCPVTEIFKASAVAE